MLQRIAFQTHVKATSSVRPERSHAAKPAGAQSKDPGAAGSMLLQGVLTGIAGPLFAVKKITHFCLLTD